MEAVWGSVGGGCKHWGGVGGRKGQWEEDVGSREGAVSGRGMGQWKEGGAVEGGRVGQWE